MGRVPLPQPAPRPTAAALLAQKKKTGYPLDPQAADALLKAVGNPRAPLSIAFAVHILALGVPGEKRIEQLRSCLKQNLDQNREDKAFVAFVIVDFGSTAEVKNPDGSVSTVESLILENAADLEEGYLFYMKVEPALQKFHCSYCKNTSCRMAVRLGYDFVVSLDCDGYTGPRGGRWLLSMVSAALEGCLVSPRMYGTCKT